MRSTKAVLGSLFDCDPEPPYSRSDVLLVLDTYRRELVRIEAARFTNKKLVVSTFAEADVIRDAIEYNTWLSDVEDEHLAGVTKTFTYNKSRRYWTALVRSVNETGIEVDA